MKHFGQFESLVILAGTALFSGCETIDSPPEPVSPASRRSVESAAKRIQSLGDGRLAVAGRGDSMDPVFGENTILVIHPIDYDELEEGMIVAYRDQFGRRVVHSLIRQTVNGWKAAGLNNFGEDAGWVTRQNLIGQVYAVFNSEVSEAAT